MLTPAQFPLQIVKRVPQPFDGDDWLFEIKHDGFRCVAIRDGGLTRLFTRRRRDITARHRHLVEQLDSLPAKRFVLDGELVALDDDGRSNFSRLMNGRQGSHFYAFDLLVLDGNDLRASSLVRRKRALKKMLRSRNGNDLVRYTDHVDAHGSTFFEAVKQAGLEGLVAKRRLSPYSGRLTDDWLKIKCMRVHHFVVGGWSADFDALLIGELVDGDLRYVGKVASGFDRRKLESITRKLVPQTKSPFMDSISEREVRFCAPAVRVPVQFLELTEGGFLRHARLRLFA